MGNHITFEGKGFYTLGNHITFEGIFSNNSILKKENFGLEFYKNILLNEEKKPEKNSWKNDILDTINKKEYLEMIIQDKNEKIIGGSINHIKFENINFKRFKET